MNFNKISVLIIIVLFSTKLIYSIGGGREERREKRLRKAGRYALMNLNKGLINAAKNGNYEEVQKAIAERANVNFVSEYNETPLSEAIRNKHFNIAQLLIDNGANINRRFGAGFTLLMEEAANGNLDSVEFLLKNVADADLTYRLVDKIYDAAEIAKTYGNFEIANYIQNYKRNRQKMLEETNFPPVLIDLVEEYTGFKRSEKEKSC